MNVMKAQSAHGVEKKMEEVVRYGLYQEEERSLARKVPPTRLLQVSNR
jgi:hypothetical protein